MMDEELRGIGAWVVELAWEREFVGTWMYLMEYTVPLEEAEVRFEFGVN